MGIYVGDNLVAGNTGEVYSKAQVDTMIANAVALAEPTGSIKPFAGTTIPNGYLLCDGSAVSRTTYAALFAVIGTTYGSGDGSTTFNLPNCNRHNPYHDPNAPLGHYHSGYVPNITGFYGIVDRSISSGVFSGALYGTPTTKTAWAVWGNAGSGGVYDISFNASRVSDAYWEDRTVLAAGINMYWCIKY